MISDYSPRMFRKSGTSPSLHQSLDKQKLSGGRKSHKIEGTQVCWFISVLPLNAKSTSLPCFAILEPDRINKYFFADDMRLACQQRVLEGC